MDININIFDKYIEMFLNILPVSIAQDFANFHPYLVILAVSLPIISIAFQASNKKDLNTAANYLYIAGIVFIILSFISGKSIYYDLENSLSSEGLALLNTHAQYATFIILTYLIVLLFKAFYLISKKAPLKNFNTLIMILEAGLIAITAKTGIDLVFKYGAGVMLG